MERREAPGALAQRPLTGLAQPAARLARRASPLAKGPAPPGAPLIDAHCRRTAPGPPSGARHDNAPEAIRVTRIIIQRRGLSRPAAVKNRGPIVDAQGLAP